MNKLVAGKASILVLTAALAVSAFLLGKSLTSVFANGNPGAIWTTKNDCGDSSQDVNHYDVGDHVYINGSGFDPDTYAWDITGKPGGASSDPNITVASDNYATTGDFCFDAYTVQSGDLGEYAVSFGKKGDNYRVGAEADVCNNIAGNQVVVPEGYVESNGGCYIPVCADQSYENYGGQDGIFDPTTEIANNDLCSNEPVDDVCPNLNGNQQTIPDGYHFETVGQERQCIQDTPPPTDVCANIDGVQTSVPSDLHLDAAGQNCVGFSTTNPPENPSSPQGQVLGASTMAATGSFTENLYLAIMAIGGTLSAFGIKKFAKASR